MQAQNLDTIFSALADPTRRAILLRLTLGEATVTELAEPFDISLPAISKHLKVLERAGLITRGKEAQFRPCRLETEHLKLAFEWLEQYHRHWEESFDRLDELLAEVQNEAEAIPMSVELMPTASPGPVDVDFPNAERLPTGAAEQLKVPSGT
jgi:DNA-binding transcriptional ArsR family regulator